MAKKNRFNRISRTESSTTDQVEVDTEFESEEDQNFESEVVAENESDSTESDIADDELVDDELVELADDELVDDEELDIEEDADSEDEALIADESDSDPEELDEDFEIEAEMDVSEELDLADTESEESEEPFQDFDDDVVEELAESSSKNYRPFLKKKIGRFSSNITALENESVVESAPGRSLAEIQKEMDLLIKTQEKLVAEQRITSTNLAEAERAAQDFAQFVTAVENSIAWRLKSRFEGNLKSVDSDLEKILQVSEGIDVSEVGYLVKIRRLFLRRFWKATLFATLAIVIFIALQDILEDSENSIARYIVEYPLPSFITSVLILWTSSNFTFIVWYYKTWSSYERALRLSEVKLLWVRDALKQAQESKSKLTKLYAHAEQWIGLIALSLHHPWKTDPKWEQASGSILSDEKLPNAVTVAQAVEGSAGAMAALERTAVARLLRPGWREQIFMRQIAAVARHQGIQQEKYTIETFDKDSPSIPNGSRNFFVDNFRDSLVQLAVARSYLSELSIEVQTVGLLESKPPVKNDYVDDLSVIAEDLDLLGEVEVDQAWDGFLLDIVGNERDPIIPISPFSFTDRAVIENAHGLPKVHIQMPMRLRSLTENLESDRILISAYEDSARLPLDLVVRVDFVGPLEPEMLKLWSREVSHTSQASSVASREEIKTSVNCSSCGRRDCPAAAPGSTIACTYSGV